MARLSVPQDGEHDLGVTESETVQMALHRQRQRDTVQSIISSVLIVALIAGVLIAIKILSMNFKSPTIVTYQAPRPEIEEVERPEVNQRARPNPPGQKSSRAKVIAATAPSPEPKSAVQGARGRAPWG